MEETLKGMSFGVFDHLHDGHRYFLSQALLLCDTLVVVVADPDAAVALKTHAPKQSWEERAAAVAGLDTRITVVRGDSTPGTWSVLDTHQPDIFILGYDQKALAEALKTRGTPAIFAGAHRPEVFKSSLLSG